MVLWFALLFQSVEKCSHWNFFSFNLQASVVLEQIEWQENYPMDFYANASLGPWTVNNERNRQIPVSRRKKNLHTEKLSAENAPSNLKDKEGCDGQTKECCGKCHQEKLLKLQDDLKTSLQ